MRIQVIFSKYSGRAIFLLVFLPAILAAQRMPDNVIPLKNWSTPLYWQPNQAEREAAARAVPQNPAPQFQLSPNAVSTEALTFVAMTPCRLVDTRGAAVGFIGEDPFAGPSLMAGQTATFPLQSTTEQATTEPAPCGVIPTIAQAYSFNVTVVPHAAGAVNYVTVWPAGATRPVVSTLNDSQGLIVANAAIVSAGATSGGVSLYNYGPATTDVIIDMNGFFAAPTDLNGNTAVGMGALAASTGVDDTAAGVDALGDNTTGSQNIAAGVGALQDNTSGTQNVASGASAMGNNTSGNMNTASGFRALSANTTGSVNTASGIYAMSNNTFGQLNTAFGANALESNTGGSSNIAVGYAAGGNAPPANSKSIYIGSEGTTNDTSGTIQIGQQGLQTGGTYIAGISGASVSSGVEVMIDSNGAMVS